MTDPNTLDQIQTHSRQRLSPHSESAGLDAQTLLAHVLKKDRAWLLAHPETPLTPDQHQEIEAALQTLESGVPLPYVIGEWEFYGRKFIVAPDVLIPRPETELMIENALHWLKKHPDRRKAIDVGTGSGCIAVTLAAERSNITMTGVDISSAALDIARRNADRHNTKIDLIESDLLENVKGKFDLICANLPYIPTKTLKGLEVFGKEPTLALDGGPDGLGLIQKLLEQAQTKLNPGGVILIEFGAPEADLLRDTVREYFPEADLSIKADLAGHLRLMVIQMVI